ncbi:hypothetical protein G7083_03340 [Vibrio sp. HDW18]|uniref:hypothetical protein n=1 Tax=Vibrio sp. HDW18 TaxID=2714948 RepID=UPI00140DD3E0|nr:hypothetical protein [Vibrio sp. HDW18]QIL85037.1 hypothetical protein G7083_03340 [Vibrio sp. HDW18]
MDNKKHPQHPKASQVRVEPFGLPESVNKVKSEIIQIQDLRGEFTPMVISPFYL